ncbi:restriction endonuclease subunit S [Arthrobacter sp. STN4]|uniref:restriction endonuclease subunit S n=1 Tax=Arthrobacter sp. STN4 TaxID=2923276 RepID=UPI00211A4C01|nr:restriction endonuclease subunit S [Arthrobacter sp. STN4]MCQ9164116.1 restriction endonuclease subunit S [Arthrobacter sp. STN4]
MVDPLETLPFLDVFADKTGGNPKVQTSEYLASGRYPIIDQGRRQVAGYSNEKSLLAVDHGPVIIFGDHTRILKYVEGPFILGADGTKVLVPKIDADVRFLFHYLRFIDIPSAGYSRHFKFLKEVRIPLPPLPEQRRIAAILDKADHLRAQRREAIAHLDALTQSIFNDMFGSLPPEGVLSDAVSALIGGKNIVGADDSTNPFRVLKISAVTSGQYLESESKALPSDYIHAADHVVRPGDVIISRANTTELVGASALVDATNGQTVLPDKLWRAVPTGEIDPHYLVAALQSDRIRAEISCRSTGSGGSMKNISKPKLLSVPIAIPPLELQQTFARRVAGVERLKEQHRAQLAQLDTLFASFQHRAFSGRL